MANEFSMTPRWVVPLLKGAECSWSYRDYVPADRYVSENNGDTAVLDEAAQVGRLAFPALVGLEEHPRAMYSALTAPPRHAPVHPF